MLLAILILTFITILCIVLILSKLLLSNRILVLNRLSKVSKKEKIIEAHDELNLPLYTRAIKPALDSISKAISNIMPSVIKLKMEKKLLQAGNPFGLNIGTWINLQIGLLVGFPLFTVIVSILGKSEPKKLVIILIFELVLGIILPQFMLSKKIVQRNEEMVRTLPDILDLLTVSVEAGLGFDAALSRVVDKMPGELSGEFEKAIYEMRVGTSRKEALKNMTKRVDVPDLTTFIGSIIQADQLGVSIGNVLRIQSLQMRQKRRQRAQEKAMKAPVKMLFPMVFFIFPTIFAVLLGPVVIKLANNFIR